MNVIVSVNIQTEGMWPTHKELDVRDAILQELDRREFGKFQGAGAGLGSMDIAYEVSNEFKSMRELQRVVESRVKSQDYTLQAMPVDASRSASPASAESPKTNTADKSRRGHLDMGM